MENEKDISKVIQKITALMRVSCRVEINDETTTDSTLVSVFTDEPADFLVGKDGQTLRAFEHVVRSIFKEQGAGKNIVLDINGYRHSRAMALAELAKAAVSRVKATQKPEALEPMTAYERRLVHVELANHPDVVTESIGQEPQRRVVIKPTQF